MKSPVNSFTDYEIDFPELDDEESKIIIEISKQQLDHGGNGKDWYFYGEDAETNDLDIRSSLVGFRS